MPVNLDSKLIDPRSAALEPMLRRLQGNILKGHGREHTVHFFLRFADDPERVRQELTEVARRFVTSAWQQQIETDEFKHFGIPGKLFGNLLLSADGYRALGFSDAVINGAFDEEPGDFGIQSSFRSGMKAHVGELNDPAVEEWEKPYQERIDAMLLLADDDPNFLLRVARDVLNQLKSFATVVTVELGNALRNEQREGIEHFGYVDGRSQPIYYETDIAGEGFIDKWNPAEPLKRVLVPDPLVAEVGGNPEDALGSYFVFRKLEQDVLHFKLAEQELADVLGLQGPDRERAGAMAVGRFEDGTPLALSQTDGFIPAKENNFSFDVDPDGLKCPFQGHIRKTNPRGDIIRKLVPGGSEEDLERRRRITRRGITYGKRNAHPLAFQSLEDMPTGGVGLLFMCFQSSIANQFAFMQRDWANAEEFVLSGTGVDPVIGQAAAGSAAQEWPRQWGQPDTGSFSFEGFVHFKGGEYFFAPSITFLESLPGAS